MRILKVYFIIIMLLTLSSCAFQGQRTKANDGVVVSSEETEVVQTPSREAVFIYGDPKLPKSLELKLSGEPLLFPSGYVRLVGVVSGWKPIACLEVGGRGLALGNGDEFDGYRVESIYDNKVVLFKKGDKR